MCILHNYVDSKANLKVKKIALCDQLFLNENACSADESSANVLFKHPSTTFV